MYVFALFIDWLKTVVYPKTDIMLVYWKSLWDRLSLYSHDKVKKYDDFTDSCHNAT